MRASRVSKVLAAIGLACFSFIAELRAATPEQQLFIQTNTFEVVMKKPEKDPLTYEKPLPLDLLPYTERTDVYQSIGTAFALGHNRYVTAAHVVLVGIDSQFGPPALRRSDGKVFSIDRILNFSEHQDFVVFSLVNDPAPLGFATHREPKIDEPVLAVGNALGDGIVIRDGQYTSATAEEQDGRWKWIRFSAAASPGNSGGPLLDREGRVIGVVIGKSPNENLNYSLPIAEVLDAPDGKALFDQRDLNALPYLQGTETYRYQDGFSLPLAWKGFALAYQTVINRHAELARKQLLTTYASTLFPKGSGAESVLYAPNFNHYLPRLIAQEEDNSWSAASPDFTETDLGGDGSISVGYASTVELIRLNRPHAAADDAFYRDSKAFMDLALKGLSLRRPVGADLVRVTSLGAALEDSIHIDHYGRRWQQRAWVVPFMDVYVECLLLPTPDGYAGLVQYVPSGRRSAARELGHLLVDQIDVSLTGTLAQWRAYLARRALLPAAFDDVILSDTPQWSLQTKRFTFSIPPSLLALTDKSVLGAVMAFVPDGSHVVWDLQGVFWQRDEQGKASVGLLRRLRPPASAKRELRSLFEDMRVRRTPFDGEMIRDSASTYSVSIIEDVPGTSAGMASSDLLYQIRATTDRPESLGSSAQFLGRLAAAVRISEAGVGEDIVPAQPLAVMETSTIDAFIESGLKRAAVADSEFGLDIRGRAFSDDFKDLMASARSQLATPSADGEQMEKEMGNRFQILMTYWRLVPAVRNNRDLWDSYLARNQRSGDNSHRPEVIAREKALKDNLAAGVTEASALLARQLVDEYVKERNERGFTKTLTEVDYHSRVSPCPDGAMTTSGSLEPKIGVVTRTPDEFYPQASRREGVEGRVILSIRVSATGCPTKVAVAGSSGSVLIDEAAQRFAETIEYLPAVDGGKAIEANAPLAVNFQIRE